MERRGGRFSNNRGYANQGTFEYIQPLLGGNSYYD